MDNRTANIVLAAMLEVCADIAEGSPRGIMYVGLAGQVTLDEFNLLVSLATRAGVLELANDVLTITERGRAMVDAIRAAKAVAA